MSWGVHGGAPQDTGKKSIVDHLIPVKSLFSGTSSISTSVFNVPGMNDVHIPGPLGGLYKCHGGILQLLFKDMQPINPRKASKEEVMNYEGLGKMAQGVIGIADAGHDHPMPKASPPSASHDQGEGMGM